MLPAFRQSRTKCRSSAKLSFFSFPGTFCRMFAAASHIILYVNAGKEGQAGRQSYLATAHDKSTGRRPAFSFTRGKGFGAKKKLVARILKSEPLILKSKAHIFGCAKLLLTGMLRKGFFAATRKLKSLTQQLNFIYEKAQQNLLQVKERLALAQLNILFVISQNRRKSTKAR